MIPIPEVDDWIKAYHYNAILDHFKKPKLAYDYQSIDDWFKKNGNNKSFQDVILANSEELETIKDKYKTAPLDPEIMYISKTLYTKCFADDKKGLSSNGYSAAILMEFLEIKVCPYCNRNYIDNFYYSDNGIKRTCQFDHFHNKAAAPFLAVSINNLVPSCSTCNHIKSNHDIKYSPYNYSLGSTSLGSFSFSIKSIDFVNNLNHLDIVFNAASILQENKKRFRLEERYKTHKDVVQQMCLKKIIYNDIKLKELLDDFKGVFKSEDELRNFVFGELLEENNYHKKPLSKLTNDIFRLI